MASALSDVAIIGAGLGVFQVPGTALALALKQQGISCRIYEARPPNASEIGSGVVLTPNGLRVLDKIGVLARISPFCWKAEYRTFKNDKDETTLKQLITNESLYGYKNHRLYRKILLEEMKTMLQEQNVPIVYEAKFEGITTDEQGGVTFIVNGKEEHASMVIGSDGINSKVREHLDPDAILEYTGVMGVICHINRNTVKWPYEEFEKACTIQGKPGAMFMIPEVPDGSEIMVGKQAKHPDQSRAEWDAMAADKDRLCDFFRDGYDQWHDTAKSIIDSACAHKETLFLWPFMKMPTLKRWSSDTGRVILVGDGAHALPPSSGQGVNQALEDVYTLSLILKSNVDLQRGLRFWQDMRQTRIDAIFDYATNSINVSRMSEEERNQLIREGKVKDPNSSESEDMSWLYQPELDKQVNDWIRGGNV